MRGTHSLGSTPSNNTDLDQSSFLLMNGVKQKFRALHPPSATREFPKAQDRHPNCSNQLGRESSSVKQHLRAFPGCFLLLSFASIFQAFVLEGQRRLHSSLRQVSDADGDGDADGDADTDVDADADRWHQESDCCPLPQCPHSAVMPPIGPCIAQGQKLLGRWIFSCKEHRQCRLVHGW